MTNANFPFLKFKIGSSICSAFDAIACLSGKIMHILCVDAHNNLYGDANFFNGAFASENSIAPRLELIPTPFVGFLAAGAGHRHLPPSEALMSVVCDRLTVRADFTRTCHSDEEIYLKKIKTWYQLHVERYRTVP